MNVFQRDRYRDEVLRFLQEHAQPLDPILAPIDFLNPFPGAYFYHVDHTLSPDYFRYVVIHKGMLDHIHPEFLRQVLERFYVVLANRTFVVYQPHRPSRLAPVSARQQQLLIPPQPAQFTPPVSTAQEIAIVVTTHNRPWALARSLPQIVRLDVPVLVVDDASSGPARQENARIVEQHNGAQLLYLPSNRGHCCATGIGVEYWLADYACKWISAFEDDVDVQPETLEVLAAIQDPHARPFLTGLYAREHAVVRQELVAGSRVLLQRSTRGTHNHAHRDYWRGVLPIPTPYLGAPKRNGLRPGQGSEIDWWITAWAPSSITKRGGHVVCVPDLVHHFAKRADQSTWSNPAWAKPAGRRARRR